MRALEAGADDYVTKPFGPGELVARLQGGAAPGAGRAQDEPVSRADGLEVDLAGRIGAPRRRGGPPDADGVRAAPDAGAAIAGAC